MNRLHEHEISKNQLTPSLMTCIQLANWKRITTNWRANGNFKKQVRSSSRHHSGKHVLNYFFVWKSVTCQPSSVSSVNMFVVCRLFDFFLLIVNRFIFLPLDEQNCPPIRFPSSRWRFQLFQKIIDRHHFKSKFLIVLLLKRKRSIDPSLTARCWIWTREAYGEYYITEFETKAKFSYQSYRTLLLLPQSVGCIGFSIPSVYT
jgi:hypothetical protein